MVAKLPIGTLLESEDSAAASVLIPKLNRHTFWCGQSGSGKTYALGVLLEQVLLRTALPVVVLDPNADFVRLPEVRETAPEEDATQLRERDIRVRRPVSRSGRDGGDQPLLVRLLGMPLKSRAAVLGIDPIADAELYNEMLRLELEIPHIGQGRLLDYLRSRPHDIRHRLAMRLENIGVTDWSVWAWGGRAITDEVRERPDAVVADLSGFDTSAEMHAVALAILDDLWARREERQGQLIVIDEAHNLCSPEPETAVQRLLTERIVQIAAEGRKYGLWLLLSTQRPSKLHPNALSQCDNLALMRMSSSRDLDELAQVFGFAPASLIERSASFAQGQALFAGASSQPRSSCRWGIASRTRAESTSRCRCAEAATPLTSTLVGDQGTVRRSVK